VAATRSPKKLPRSFYARPTLEVAPDLLGKFIVYRSPRGRLAARITEVEAYIGQDDPACHASRGKTARNEVMFGPPGFSYIYFIYGMYYCLNVVTEPEGQPAAVLVRAADPAEGLDLIARRSSGNGPHAWLAGPGKLCRGFGLTRRQNGIDLTRDVLYLEDRHAPVEAVGRSPRIGIRVGAERMWRFYDQNAKSLSRPG